MSVPNMARTLKGWTKKRVAQVIIKGLDDNGLESETKTSETLEMNIQPMPQQVIARKPQEQWSWNWFSVVIKNGTLLKTDDAIIIENDRYRIQKLHDWSLSGFQKYEAVVDYDYVIPDPE